MKDLGYIYISSLTSMEVSNRVDWSPRRDEKVDLFKATLK